MIDSKDIQVSVGMLDRADPTQWNEDGSPKIEAVRRLMSNDAVTDADVAAAMGRPAPTIQTAPKFTPAAAIKAEGDGGTKATGAAPATATVPDAGTVEGIGADNDLAAQARQRVMATQAVKDAEFPILQDMVAQRRAIDEAIAAKQLEVDKLDRAIEADSVKVTDAEAIKKVQQQTQDDLLKRHRDADTVAKALGTAAPTIVPSPLDAALQAGIGRSTVLVNGKPYQAPHPRSMEGVRNYGTWIHGQRQAV
jgi:hypothetical protein